MHPFLPRWFLLNLLCILMAAQHARAAQPNVMVLRVGDGAAALSSASTPAFLEERQADGGLVRIIPLPTVASGVNKPCTIGGSATAEGLISRSADGQYVILAGYNTGTGTANVSSTTSATVNRVIARVDFAGAVDSTTSLSDVASAVSVRSACSSDGLSFWVGGAGGGVHYALLGSTTSTDLTSATLANARQLAIFSNQLYVTSSVGTNTFRGVSTIGAGLPASGAQSVTRLTGLTDSLNPSNYSFAFCDLSASVAGVDTLYIADDSIGLSKFSLVAGSWVSNGTADTTGTPRGLAAIVSGTTVSLFCTHTPTQLATLVDIGGYNAPFSGTTATIISTAATNTAYRGVSLAPQAPVDLTLTVGDAPHTVTAGSGAGNLVYTVTLTNNGPNDATGVVVTNTQVLSAGVTLDSALPSVGSFDSGSGQWTVGNFANGASASLTFTATVSASADEGAGVISASASVTANENLINLADDTATQSTDIVRSVDLSVTVSDAPHTVVAGSGAGNLIYTVTLKNNGPSDASGIVLTNAQTLPSGVTLLSGTPSTGNFDSGSGQWTVATLASGAAATLALTNTVALAAAVGTNVISDSASVTANETLINTADDMATQATNVIHAVDLTVAVTQTPGPIVAGSGAGNLVYTVTVKNNGPADATNLKVLSTQVMPVGVSLLSATATAGTSFNSSNGLWTIGTLALSGTATLTLTDTVSALAAVGTGVVSDTTSVSANETLFNTSDDNAAQNTNVTFALLSGPAAAPATAGVGQPLMFTVSTAGNGLTYDWAFSDGSNASGAVLIHTFTAAGTFTATVTVSGPGIAPQSAGVMVTIVAPLIGTGDDSDGDGFSDDFETLAGSDAHSAASTPTGSPATLHTTLPLTISKTQIKLTFTGGGKDSIAFSGTLAIPAGFMPANQKVTCDVGGVGKSLTLNAKGSAKVGYDSLKISVKSSKGVIAAQTAKFSAAFSKGTFAAALADEGLTGDASVKSQPRTVLVTLVFNNAVLQKAQALSYTATKSKSGSAK